MDLFKKFWLKIKLPELAKRRILFRHPSKSFKKIKNPIRIHCENNKEIFE